MGAPVLNLIHQNYLIYYREDLLVHVITEHYSQLIPLQKMSNVRGQSRCQRRHRAEDRDQGFYGYSSYLASDQVH